MACTFRDRETIIALRVLADILCGDNQAPLKRRMLESGLAKDVQMSVRDGVQQPWASLEAKDIDAARAEDVSRALRSELERLVRDGLDHQRILATLDNLEFQMRQRDYGRMPQGLVFSINVLESWLYGGDPAANLVVGDLFENLRKKCGDGYFEELLENVLLKNPHTSSVLMLPSHTAGQERQEREAARLQSAAESWDANEMAALHRKQAELEEWQNTPDTPESLATIPMLRLDQIPAEPEELPVTEGKIEGMPLLRHTLSTGGITYLNLYFSLNDLTAEQLTKTAFLCELLGAVDTTTHSADELQKMQRSLFGGLQFSTEAYGELGQPDRCRTFLCVSASMLDTKASSAAELLLEIIQNTVLDDSEKIFDLLCQRRAMLTDQIVMAGHSAAMGRVAACCTAEGAVQEHTGGIAYYRWLKELEQDFEKRFPVLQKELAELSAMVFSRKRLTVSVTASETNTEAVIGKIFAECLPEGTCSVPETSVDRPWERRREGIVIPADVSFAALGGVFPSAGCGTAKVMGRMVSLAHLWNAVRVQGGAYGTGMVLNDNCFAGFYSYRDPDAARTLDCYKQTADFLEQLGSMDISGFILGAIAESDPLLTPRMKGKTADARYWRNTTQADLCRIRREMLDTKSEDLAELAKSVRSMTETGAICVLGSQRQLDACAGILDVDEAL